MKDYPWELQRDLTALAALILFMLFYLNYKLNKIINRHENEDQPDKGEQKADS
jgi:hypothetical protein